jgi:hypothetical protein
MTTDRKPPDQTSQQLRSFDDPVSRRHLLKTNATWRPDSSSCTVSSLFAVGLDLAAVRNLVDGEAADRLQRAVRELDAVIAAIRSDRPAVGTLPAPN